MARVKPANHETNLTVSAEKGFAASDEENPLYFDDGGEAIGYE